jgi:hypothetical protein
VNWLYCISEAQSAAPDGACAAAMFYKNRTKERILAESVANGMTAGEVSRLKKWLEKGRVDLKRRDARSLIRILMEHPESLDRPMQAPFQFETTTFWLELIDRHDPEADEELKSAS